MRQARDLLYLTVHLGSNPNPGVFVVFVSEVIEVALNGRKINRIYDKKADGDFEAHLVALCCNEPPEGFARWSFRLLADKVVELEYIDSISHETVSCILKKPKLSPGNKKVG